MKPAKYIIMSICEAIFVITPLLLILAFNTTDHLRPDPVFDDGMIIQSHKLYPVWGTSNANEIIEVFFNDQFFKSKSDSKGNWEINLPPMESGGPYEMIFTSKKKTITLSNIYIE